MIITYIFRNTKSTNMEQRGDQLGNLQGFKKYVVCWMRPRKISTTRRLSSVFVAKRNNNENKNDDDLNKNVNMIRFSYGQQPFACRKVNDCPMRFHDESSQLVHEKYGHNNTMMTSQTSKIMFYRCHSCMKSNRRVQFSTKEELLNHHMNPEINQRQRMTGVLNVNYKPFTTALPGITTILRK